MHTASKSGPRLIGRPDGHEPYDRHLIGRPDGHDFPIDEGADKYTLLTDVSVVIINYERRYYLIS